MTKDTTETFIVDRVLVTKEDCKAKQNKCLLVSPTLLKDHPLFEEIRAKIDSGEYVIKGSL